MKHYRIENIKEKSIPIITIIITTAVIIAFIVIIMSSIANEKNRISEGIIIDKEYSEAHQFADVYDNRMSYQKSDAQYKFCIEGRLNGKEVKYWFSVTKEEYLQYKVGDYYKK